MKQAVIAVPANFNELQKSETIKAFEAAGLSVLSVLEEVIMVELLCAHT